MQLKQKLKKIISRSLYIALLGTSFFVSPIEAMEPILSLNEVYEGMEGTGYTVVDASGEIVPFDVRIIGVLEGGNGSQSAIIAKASGAVIDETGGIVHGMSGSPIYINERLIGAASATLKEMDAKTFIITPIESMLEIWQYPDLKKPKKPKMIDFKKIAADKEKRLEKEKEKKEAKEKIGKETEKKESSEIPPTVKLWQKPQKPSKDENLPTVKEEKPEYRGTMYMAGFDARSAGFLKNKLASLGYQAVSLAGIKADTKGNTEYNAKLEGGSSIGVAVAHGDFMVGSMGTVTAVDDNRILGFGHSMLNRGNVSYFLTQSNILGTVNGPTDGMKIGNVRKIIGRVNQDRSTGIGGIIGEYPSVVTVRTSVEEKTLKKKQTFATSIAYDETFLPLLTQGIAYASLNKTADHLAESTVKVKLSIKTNAIKEPLERTNMYYAIADTGAVAFLELAEIMTAITSNIEKECDIYDVKLDISTEAKRKTATLISAVPDRPEVRPGDTVIFKTTIKPYRGKSFVVDIPFTVPKSKEDGEYILDMHGGGLIALGLMPSIGMKPNEHIPSTEESLYEILSRNQNNEIIVEPGIAQLMSESDTKKAIEEAIKKSDAILAGEIEPEEPPIGKIETEYIIENVITATVTVNKNAPYPEKKKEIKKDKKEERMSKNEANFLLKPSKSE